jgi:hypothetical protein
MAKVRVWNDNVHPYRETFREQNIHIPAKSSIVMDAGEALLFKGTFAPIKLDGDGNPTPEGYKMIRIEELQSEDTIEQAKVNPLVCQACAYEAASEKDLNEHAQSLHKDAFLVDEEAEQALSEKKKAQRKAG